MKLIPSKTPGFVKSIFPNFIWNIDTNSKELYLTFDDGPTPEITPWVLEQLQTYNAKATFFCIGNNIEKYPEILKTVIADGHSVGNHTFNHLKGWKYKSKTYVDDVLKCEALLPKTNSSNLKLFRPPYGKFKTKQSKQLQKLGYKIVLWDVLSFDWDAKISESQCFNTIINVSKKGSIIVMHDSLKASQNLKAVLPKVLKYYSELGFTFKSIPTIY